MILSADNNLETVNYNSLKHSHKVNNFITSFEFLEENNEIGSDSYLLSDIIINLMKKINRI